MIDLENAKKEFIKYTHQFNQDNKLIEIKFEHSFRVMEIIKEIATNMKLSKEEIDLATLIGLLHDIGRFYQIEETNSVKDTKLNHAHYGVKYLFEEGHIRDFIVDTRYDNIIKYSIAYHGDFALPSTLNKEEELFCRLIRDADKIDIYRVYAECFNHKFKSQEVSDNVKNALFSGHSVLIRDIKSKSDSTVCVLAFINDISFKESFQKLRQTKNFDKYVSHIEVDDTNLVEWQKYIDYCQTVINEKSK